MTLPYQGKNVSLICTLQQKYNPFEELLSIYVTNCWNDFISGVGSCHCNLGLDTRRREEMASCYRSAINAQT